MGFGPSFPGVVKVGHAHAGMGKMIANDAHQFADFSSVLAMTNHYVTGEPFLEGEYDLRIQKIGSHYRAFKRYSVCGNWKTNTGSASKYIGNIKKKNFLIFCFIVIEQIEITDEYKFWVDEASKIFGGLDILAVVSVKN